MGRHSAPDDDSGLGDSGLDPRPDDQTSGAVATVPHGRHAHTDDEPDDGPPTEGLTLLEDVLDAPPADVVASDDHPSPIPSPGPGPGLDFPAPTGSPIPPPATPLAGPVAGSAHATRQDFALVRQHGDVRARALAAVLVPFVVYVAVLAVIGDLTVHSLIWVWAPAVAAGVLVGLVLDAGHKRYPTPTPDAVDEPVRS